MKKFTNTLKYTEFNKTSNASIRSKRIICDGSSEFYSLFFNMKKWWFAATNIGEKEGPYIFIGESEGIPSLFLFTNSKRASDFAIENKIKTNENGEYVIVKTPLSIITSIAGYKELGITRVVIDLCWQLELDQFKKLYFFFAHNFELNELVKSVNKTNNTFFIGELWTTIFNLPAWYFVGDLEKGFVHGKKLNDDRFIFLYLSSTEVVKTINEINRADRNIIYKVYKYEPRKGYEFLLFMKKEAAVNGIMLKDKDVYSGVSIETITRVKEIFEI